MTTNISQYIAQCSQAGAKGKRIHIITTDLDLDIEYYISYYVSSLSKIENWLHWDELLFWLPRPPGKEALGQSSEALETEDWPEVLEWVEWGPVGQSEDCKTVSSVAEQWEIKSHSWVWFHHESPNQKNRGNTASSGDHRGQHSPIKELATCGVAGLTGGGRGKACKFRPCFFFCP